MTRLRLSRSAASSRNRPDSARPRQALELLEGDRVPALGDLLEARGSKLQVGGLFGGHQPVVGRVGPAGARDQPWRTGQAEQKHQPHPGTPADPQLGPAPRPDGGHQLTSRPAWVMGEGRPTRVAAPVVVLAVGHAAVAHPGDPGGGRGDLLVVGDQQDGLAAGT